MLIRCDGFRRRHRLPWQSSASCWLVCVAMSSAATGQGFSPLGDLPGPPFSSAAYGVSSDGSVVVGLANSANRSEAFRWTQAGGMVGLGDMIGGAGLSGTAYAVSGDGAVVVGIATGTRGLVAFRWTEVGGMTSLGNLPSGTGSQAMGVNRDGTVVVGYGTGTLGQEAFRWTQAGGLVGLGDLAGGTFSSAAYGASSDGTVVVGYGTSASGQEAFRWTPTGGLVGLGDLAGGTFSSTASAVNSDGTVVVGHGTSASGQEAFRWTQTGGMSGLGDLAGGTFSIAAQGVSSDGLVVVGYGHTGSGKEAFRWTAAQGMQRVADWLAAAGVVLASGYTLTEARGVSVDGSVVVGSSSGPNGSEAYLARVSSLGSGAVTLGAYGHRGEVELRRGYLNAGHPDLSSGKPAVTTWGVRARLDWSGAFRIGRAEWSPYVDLSHARAKLGGYTEIGGGFPARFEARRQSATELRAGMQLRYPLQDGVSLLGSLEAAHRFQKTGAPTTGQLLGLFTFQLPGASQRRDWSRAGIGVERELASGVASVWLYATTQGLAPSAWVAANWQKSF